MKLGRIIKHAQFERRLHQARRRQKIESVAGWTAIALLGLVAGVATYRLVYWLLGYVF